MHEYDAVVTKVYDGDTITVDIDLGFGTWIKGEKIRLYGINTPEVRGSEKVRGLAVRDYVRSLILGKTVKLHTVKKPKTTRGKKGKYGRYLGFVFIEDGGVGDLAADLVRLGYAKRLVY